MDPEAPTPPAASQPLLLRRLAWAVLILIGGTVLIPLVTLFVTASTDRLNDDKLPGFLVFVVLAVLLTCLLSAFNPIRRRPDQMSLWRQQFPAQSEAEIQRFLRVVSGSLGLGEKDAGKLSPADRATDLEPLFGGMEVVELIMAVEEKYALDLPDDCLNSCANLGQLFAYVTQPATGLTSEGAPQP